MYEIQFPSTESATPPHFPQKYNTYGGNLCLIHEKDLQCEPGPGLMTWMDDQSAHFVVSK